MTSIKETVATEDAHIFTTTDVELKNECEEALKNIPHFWSRAYGDDWALFVDVNDTARVTELLRPIVPWRL